MRARQVRAFRYLDDLQPKALFPQINAIFRGKNGKRTESGATQLLQQGDRLRARLPH